MEVAYDSHEQMEGSCTEDICVGQSLLTPITGQSFLTSRFGDASILSPMDPWQIKTIDARSDSGSEEFKWLRKFLSQSDILI